MSSRLSRRLTALLCAGLFALTVLVGMVVTLPSGLAGSADFPPGPTKSAFNPQPDPPGMTAGIIIQGKTASIIVPAGIIIQD